MYKGIMQSCIVVLGLVITCLHACLLACLLSWLLVAWLLGCLVAWLLAWLVVSLLAWSSTQLVKSTKRCSRMTLVGFSMLSFQQMLVFSALEFWQEMARGTLQLPTIWNRCFDHRNQGFLLRPNLVQCSLSCGTPD